MADRDDEVGRAPTVAGRKPGGQVGRGRRSGRSAGRWRPPGGSSGIASASAPPRGAGKGEDLEVSQQVEELFEPAPSVLSATGTPAGRLGGGNSTHGQLHVRDRVAGDRGAAVGDQFDLFAVKPDPVGESGRRGQHAEVVQIGGGPHAVGPTQSVHLALGFGEMDVDRQVAIGGQADRVLGLAVLTV